MYIFMQLNSAMDEQFYPSNASPKVVEASKKVLEGRLSRHGHVQRSPEE